MARAFHGWPGSTVGPEQVRFGVVDLTIAPFLCLELAIASPAAAAAARRAAGGRVASFPIARSRAGRGPMAVSSAPSALVRVALSARKSTKLNGAWR